LCYQTRTIDARVRTFKKVEKAPSVLVQEAQDAVRAILKLGIAVSSYQSECGLTW
jgi:mRNA interferase ChpB